jgi:hypothetical protein
MGRFDSAEYLKITLQKNPEYKKYPVAFREEHYSCKD